MSNNGRNQLLFHNVLLLLLLLYSPSPRGNYTHANVPVCTFLSRHRAVNLFLQGYNKTWVSTEDHSFEEKLVEDLAVSAKVSRISIISVTGAPADHQRSLEPDPSILPDQTNSCSTTTEFCGFCSFLLRL